MRFGWGGTGPSVPGAAPAWVVGIADVQIERAVEGLRLERIEVFDASGAHLDWASTELELRVAPPDRDDFMRLGTTEVARRIEAGARFRVWAHARLDHGHDQPSVPARYVVTLVTTTGERINAQGPLDPEWPTA